MDEAPAAATGEMPVMEVRQRLTQWAEDGQQLLPMIPGVLAEHDRLTTRAEAAEQECERFRQEIAQVAETLRRVLSDTVQSLSGTLERLRASQGRGE